MFHSDVTDTSGQSVAGVIVGGLVVDVFFGDDEVPIEILDTSYVGNGIDPVFFDDTTAAAMFGVSNNHLIQKVR